MKTLKIKTTGLSVSELYKKYGTGKGGFWSSNPWWKDEAFAKEKPEAGIYEIVVEKQLTNLTYEEQTKNIKKKGWEVLHPAVLTEAILIHFKETGEQLFEDWYSRTSDRDSDGRRVCVGIDAGEVNVNRYWDDDRYPSLGLASARKLESLETQIIESSESLTLEARVLDLERKMEKVLEVLNV